VVFSQNRGIKFWKISSFFTNREISAKIKEFSNHEIKFRDIVKTHFSPVKIEKKAIKMKPFSLVAKNDLFKMLPF